MLSQLPSGSCVIGEFLLPAAPVFNRGISHGLVNRYQDVFFQRLLSCHVGSKCSAPSLLVQSAENETRVTGTENDPHCKTDFHQEITWNTSFMLSDMQTELFSVLFPKETKLYAVRVSCVVLSPPSASSLWLWNPWFILVKLHRETF